MDGHGRSSTVANGQRRSAIPVTADDPRAPYVQVADDLRRRIAIGELAPGGKLPSNTELRDSYDVASQTAQNAINRLKTEGLVYGVAGRGVFVRDDVDPDKLLTDLAGSHDGSDTFQAILTTLSRMDDAIQAITQRVDDLERHVGLHEAPPR